MLRINFFLPNLNCRLLGNSSRTVEKRTDGLDEFRQLFNPQFSFIVSDGGIEAEDFFSMDIGKLF